MTRFLFSLLLINPAHFPYPDRKGNKVPRKINSEPPKKFSEPPSFFSAARNFFQPSKDMLMELSHFGNMHPLTLLNQNFHQAFFFLGRGWPRRSIRHCS